MMNELIIKLAKEADPDYTGIYDDDMGHCLVGNEAIEKFAELIIHECVALTNNFSDGYITKESGSKEFHYTENIVEVIQEYFGVKE